MVLSSTGVRSPSVKPSNVSPAAGAAADLVEEAAAVVAARVHPTVAAVAVAAIAAAAVVAAMVAAAEIAAAVAVAIAAAAVAATVAAVAVAVDTAALLLAVRLATAVQCAIGVLTSRAARLRLPAASNPPATRVVRRVGVMPARRGASATTSRASAASTTTSELLSSPVSF